MTHNSRQLFCLDGKIALVTGGAGLYGKPISRALAEAGATVIVASRNRERCEEFAAQLREENLSCAAEQFDMDEESSIQRLNDRIVEAHGGVDILLNNAVARPMDSYEEGTPEQWADSLRVNITGIHLCTKVFSAGMIERGRGSIVNIGSIYGVFGPDFRIYEGESFTCPPDYACHKGAMIAYTKYCATRFVSHGVRVNCISPGGYLAGQADDFLARYNARIPMGRMAHDEDIAGPVVFLASEASRYITGINLIVDGGLSAW